VHVGSEGERACRGPRVRGQNLDVVSQEFLPPFSRTDEAPKHGYAFVSDVLVVVIGRGVLLVQCVTMVRTIVFIASRYMRSPTAMGLMPPLPSLSRGVIRLTQRIFPPGAVPAAIKAVSLVRKGRTESFLATMRRGTVHPDIPPAVSLAKLSSAEVISAFFSTVPGLVVFVQNQSAIWVGLLVRALR
jgi:hypothetical protein